jgi:[CysO sulfur-carrier protein]-S-L-cysteine hydrolase
VRIAREHLDAMVAHARAEAPNECCGMVAARDGEAVRVYRAANAAASPRRYEVDPRDQFRIQGEIEREGLALGAIYHSHTRSAPEPSQTDINLALTPDGRHELWPGTLYVIVGLAGGEPDLRAFQIAAGGRVTEVALEVP